VDKQQIQAIRKLPAVWAEHDDLHVMPDPLIATIEDEHGGLSMVYKNGEWKMTKDAWVYFTKL